MSGPQIIDESGFACVPLTIMVKCILKNFDPSQSLTSAKISSLSATREVVINIVIALC
jgi:hypothetical protein